MSNVPVSLNFMPAFYAKHLGLRYGEAFYFDPGYRAEVERAEGRFLHEAFGRHGAGSPDPQPSPSFFMQPVDLVLRTQGAPWRFPDDATVETLAAPWAGLTPEEISAIDPQEAAHHPVVDEVLAQFHALQRMYGDRADILWSRSGLMCIHAPYTTAHQLCGEGLFLTLLEHPAGAQRIFAKVWDIYQALFARLAAATGARFNSLLLGDCSASLLSPTTYREVVLPMNRRLASQFAQVTYHSCGPSSHLLPAFAEVPNVSETQLGAGTDLAAAVKSMPGATVAPMVDPVLMREGDGAAVRETILRILTAASSAPAVTLLAWSFDRDTPFDNVHALYDAVAEHERRHTRPRPQTATL